MQSRTTERLVRRMGKVVAVAAILFVGGGLWRDDPASAEIYKWQDAQGVVYYSNKPPSGENVRVLEVISTPILKDAEGKAYYLNAPDGIPMGGVTAEAEFTISEDQLKELFPSSSTVLAQPGTQPGLDLSALTMRLAELEKQLTREAETRLKWQNDYAQAQSVITDLEQQNEWLKSSVARMEQDIATLRGTVIASDIQIAALKMPAPNQEVAMLTGQVKDVQSSVGALKQDMASLQGANVLNQLAALSATVQTLQVHQKMDVDRAEIFKQQQAQLEAMLKKNELMERVIVQQNNLLGVQDEQIQAIKTRLAQLQQPAAQIMTAESGVQGGISVTHRIERRRPSATSRFLMWLTTPQEIVTE